MGVIALISATLCHYWSWFICSGKMIQVMDCPVKRIFAANYRWFHSPLTAQSIVSLGLYTFIHKCWVCWHAVWGTCMPGCRRTTGGRGGLIQLLKHGFHFSTLHRQCNKRKILCKVYASNARSNTCLYFFMQAISCDKFAVRWREATNGDVVIKHFDFNGSVHTHCIIGRQHNCAHWQQR